jgi:acetoacetyl-CoA synthetase
MTAPLWTPGADRVEGSNMKRFMRFVHERFGAEAPDYPALYDWSNAHPDRFWTAVWEFCGIRGSGDLTPAFEHFERMPGCRFFPRTEINFAQNLLRYRDDRPALIARGEDGSTRTLSYAELADEVRRLRAALRAEGVGEGDRVAGFVPNRPEAVIAMLATASLGAIWSSCSPDFGINGVLDRFGQIAPKVLFTADGYFYQGAFDHPQYILYSSGTTGVPKCIVHGAGGTLIQHLKELVLHTDLKREDRIFYYTTCGWMMWNWLVSGLAVGATVVLYDGSPFHPGPATPVRPRRRARHQRLRHQRQVDRRARQGRRQAARDPRAGACARSSPPARRWRRRASTTSTATSRPTCCWPRSPAAPTSSPASRSATRCCRSTAASCSAAGLGMKVEILDDDGSPCAARRASWSAPQPFPSMPVGFWNDPDGTKYRPPTSSTSRRLVPRRLRLLTEHDGIVIHGRSDATLNPGGVRIGTAEIYRQVEKLPEVLESICVGQDWDDDVRVVLFVRLREGVALDEALQARIRKVIRDNTTPRHVPAKILAVADIPRTISGKIVELAVRRRHPRPSLAGPVKNTDCAGQPAEALEQRPRVPPAVASRTAEVNAALEFEHDVFIVLDLGDVAFLGQEVAVQFDDVGWGHGKTASHWGCLHQRPTRPARRRDTVASSAASCSARARSSLASLMRSRSSRRSPRSA